MVELLSPAGDFESLKAAIQNGADAVYFGSKDFSARAFASNFNFEDLKKAITYTKLRGVKTHLTLNTLIKDEELKNSFELAKKAYEYGIDAIIVQDIGLGKLLIKSFPDLDIHASTQMTVHNLEGVLELEKLGFKRVVLSRELSINEIIYICKNSNIELECFIHGALCISYSGQCLFSSMIGGRSGNRGQCAQPCRLPYTLLENEKPIDNGYLLSTRDLCSLENIPLLIEAGVKSFKIEGRMKSSTYVATTTRLYRKYIDLALSKKKYVIEREDKKQLLQVFNRGQSSLGHMSNSPNKSLVYKEKPNNMGLFLGIVQKYNKNKYITVKLNEPLAIGDTIALENESGSYTISELMEHNKNIPYGEIGQTVTIGRMRGNIKLGDKIFKMSSKKLVTLANNSTKFEQKKIYLNCYVIIKKGENIKININSVNKSSIYNHLNIEHSLNIKPVDAKNQPLTKEKVILQLSKTTDTPYEFKNIFVDLDENVFLTKLSSLNELRRTALKKVEEYGLNNISRNTDNNLNETFINLDKNVRKATTFRPHLTLQPNKNTYNISLLLNSLNLNMDYSKLSDVDKLYIPLKYFHIKAYSGILKTLSSNFKIYISIPPVIKANYKNVLYSTINTSIEKYNIKGLIFSNISNVLLIEELKDKGNLDFIANYNFNVFNYLSVNEIKNLGMNAFTISPELDKKTINNLCNTTSLKKELIVYGKIPLINMNYCLLGGSNKCYPDCSAKCKLQNTYYLQDRLNEKFLVVPDDIQSITTIYNCKTLSVSPSDFNIDTARIDILDESIEDINNIIDIVKNRERMEGKSFTNGNLNIKI